MSKPEINVTPLIDVLLVLLIIFMVVTPLKPSSFEAKIPQEPDSDNVTVNPDTLVVSLGADSSLTVNLEDTAATIDEPDNVTRRLAEVFRLRTENMAFKQNPDGTYYIEKTVFIKAPRSTSYGDVAKVVDAVKASGAGPISLQIDNLD